MPAEAPQSAGKRKQRVGVACDFCRRRKLGCNNAKPLCENCKFYGKQCTYTERAKKERPSNFRITQLEEDNARLQKSLSELRLQLDAKAAGENDATQGEQALASPAHTGDCTPPRSQETQPSPRRRRVPDDDAKSQFHGPSSAMFDAEMPSSQKKIKSASAPAAWKKDQLLATTAKQRQMELINLNSGKLDFDGIDPDLGMHLLQVFWNRQHHSGPIVYRPLFMRDMACKGPYFSKLLLNAIFFQASKNSPRIGAQCDVDKNCGIAGWTFRKRVEELLHCPHGQLLCRSNITTIQALIIMSDALFAWCDEKSLSWLYSGVAINMIIDLGMHVEPPPQSTNAIPVEELEVRRRTFWAAFVTDKVQSIYQGRPARLREVDTDVPILFMDDFEELEEFHAVPYCDVECGVKRPSHSVSVFEQQCKLSLIMNSILCSLYTEKSGLKNPHQLYRESQILHDDLKRWRRSISEHLVIDLKSPSEVTLTPHTLSLFCMYNSLVILLHRPFVSDGHLYSSSPLLARDAFETCAAAASEIDSLLCIYKKHFCTKVAPYFMSYATYVSGTIHVRIAAQRSPGSDAHRHLENCLKVLSIQQQCLAPRRARRVLLGLMKRLKVQVDETPACDVDAERNGNKTSQSDQTEPGANAETSAGATSVDLDNPTDLNPIWSDLDIDAIMQSFDPGMREYLESSGMQATSDLAISDASTYPVDSSFDGTMQAGDPFFFADPLFGFSGTAMDIDSSDL